LGKLKEEGLSISCWSSKTLPLAIKLVDYVHVLTQGPV